MAVERGQQCYGWNSFHVEGNTRLEEEAFPAPAKYVQCLCYGGTKKGAPNWKQEEEL